MWGECEQEILESLVSEGYSLEEVQKLIRKLRKDRIKTIRAVYWQKIVWGIIIISVGVYLVLSLWPRYQDYPPRTRKGVVFMSATPVVIGIWQLMKGLIGVMTAPNRRDSISDIE
jgi:hypothetical protein